MYVILLLRINIFIVFRENTNAGDPEMYVRIHTDTFLPQ
jgi:hypothetical protein